MVNLIVTGIMVIITLVILKSGWLLTFLDNVPFIDNVASLISGYLGVTSGVAPTETAKIFFNEFLKSIVYLSVFTVISKVMHEIIHIGKHERASGLSRFFAVPLEWIASNFASAVITALVVEGVNAYLNQVLNVSKYIVAGLSTLTLILAILAAFIFLGKTLMEFAMKMVFGVVFGGAVKLIAVECIIVFLYIILNVPGVFDMAGVMVSTIVGILLCLGSIVGVEVLDDLL